MDNLILLGIGLVAGVFAGMFGIGGGLIIVPALMFILKVNQLQATGTSLAALIPPVGLLGAFEYYRNGYMNIRFAALIAIGLFIGGSFGAKIRMGIVPGAAEHVYAIFRLAIGKRMSSEGK